MKTDKEFADRLEKLQKSLDEWCILMGRLNESAESIALTLKSVARETRLEIKYQKMLEQAKEADNLALGTSTAVKNLKMAENEISNLIAR